MPSSSPAVPARSAPPSSPNCSPTVTPSSRWPARTTPRRPSRPPAPRCCAEGGGPRCPAGRRCAVRRRDQSGVRARLQQSGGARPGDRRGDRRAHGAVRAGRSDRPIVAVSGTPWVPGRASTEADPVADRRPGGRSRAVGPRAARPGRARCARHGRPHAAHLHNEQGRVRRPADRSRRRCGVSCDPGEAPSAGRPCTRSTPRSCSGWPRIGTGRDVLARRQRTRATRYGTSRRSSAGAWACRSTRCRRKTLGPLGPVFAMDQPASSSHTRDALGWQPAHPGLLDGLENMQP